MSEINRNSEDLAAARALIEALCEDRLTSEQASKLEDMIFHSSEIRRLYIRLMHLHAGLYQHASLLGLPVIDLDAEMSSPVGLGDAMVLPALPAEPEPAAQVVGRPVDAENGATPDWGAARIASGRLRRPVWAAAAIVMLAVGFAIAVVLRHGPARVANAGPVATFNQAIDAQWAVQSPPEPGKGLSNDREYDLVAGYARLSFTGGVVVVVEGPARFTVRSTGDITLASGKLSAVVPGAAKGFTVHTPSATVVDLGTEFGVRVSDAGTTDVQVYRGHVSLAATAKPGPGASRPSTDARQVIHQGDARRIEATGAVLTIAANPAAFVRPAEFKGWAKPAPASAVQRWRAYSERLRRDPGLTLYYTFDDHASAPDRLQNQALATAGQFDLPLGPNAPAWEQGRLSGLGALGFDAPRHQRLLVGDYQVSTTGQISVAAWVCLRSRTSWASIVKNRGDKKGGQFALGLWGGDGDFVARAFCDDGSEVEVREGKSSPVPTHRWLQVAMVADGSALRLFHNGTEVASRLCRPLAPDPAVRSLAIGFRTGDDGTAPLSSANAENWDGALGELAIFHRALTSEQVREMYEAGKP